MSMGHLSCSLYIHTVVLSLTTPGHLSNIMSQSTLFGEPPGKTNHLGMEQWLNVVSQSKCE